VGGIAIPSINCSTDQYLNQNVMNSQIPYLIFLKYKFCVNLVYY